MVKPNLQQYAQLAAVTAVAVGCYLIFAPFIPAIVTLDLSVATVVDSLRVIFG